MYLLALAAFVIYSYTIKEIDSSIPKRIWLEILGVQSWFYDGSINFPAWSVSCEFFFYLLFPFVLPFIARFRLKKLFIYIFSLYVFSVVFTECFGKAMPQIHMYQKSGLIHLIMDTLLSHPAFKFTTFLFGCFCGRFYMTSPQMIYVEKYSNIICLLSTTIIILCYRYDIISLSLLDAGVLCVLYFPFVLSLCSLRGSGLKILSWKPFIFLGEISYGMYILHAPLQHYFVSLITPGSSHFAKNSIFFPYTLSLVIICATLYYIYEMPARKLIVSLFTPAKKAKPSMSLSSQIS